MAISVSLDLSGQAGTDERFHGEMMSCRARDVSREGSVHPASAQTPMEGHHGRGRQWTMVFHQVDAADSWAQIWLQPTSSLKGSRSFRRIFRRRLTGPDGPIAWVCDRPGTFRSSCRKPATSTAKSHGTPLG